MNNSDRKEGWIDCYNSSQKILLVGEGDFSFSACLARAFGTAKNMVATSYLDKDCLVINHQTSVSHLEELERLGCALMYQIDVHKMHTHPILKGMKLDIIIFNFPHAGHICYLRERDTELIQKHKELVGAYFRNASKMLSEGGEVHIRHRDDSPYDRWDIVSLAVEAGLKLKEKVRFSESESIQVIFVEEEGVLKPMTLFQSDHLSLLSLLLIIPNVNDEEIRVLEVRDDEVCICTTTKKSITDGQNRR
ncbi:unnamed protein product [Lactuca virosa]|uniref:25S rRNA (uridine-N(3))-methyltransferase BMT5-like domain-containing protein n=1 Tax=Lactuca virosa TaxID=75947 RepID=A0AAU9PM85_9ASTR|nr:unnamed protein product [Lactuca virosa]